MEDDDNMFRFDYSPRFLEWYVCINIYITVNKYTCNTTVYILNMFMCINLHMYKLVYEEVA